MPQNTPKIVEINWKPNKSASVPVYSQIVAYFSERISSGDWVTGQKLPPQRALAKHFDVNRSTVVSAMEELLSLGFLESRMGDGTYVTHDIWQQLMSYSTPNWRRYIDGSSFMANKPTIQKINRLEYEPDIIRLGTGEMSPELYPEKAMSKAISSVSKRIKSLNYLPPLGLLELRKSLCDYLREKGIDAEPSNVLIVSGTLQALQLLSLCILPPHSTVYMENPSYLASLNIFQSVGTSLTGIPMDTEGLMPWMLRSDQIKSGRSLLYTIPSFQNPTGKIMSASRRTDVLHFCKSVQMPIIEDDTWSDLWFDAEPPKPLKAQDTSGIVLYVGSVSKSLAPGLRIGWLVGPEPVVQRLADVKMQTDYGSSSLSQWAVTECLDSGMFDEHMTYVRSELKARRDLMLRLLNKYCKDIADWDRPAGSYYVWLRLRKQGQAVKVFEAALKQNILLNPGDLYGTGYEQYFRLCFAYETEENLEKGLRIFSEIVRSEM